MKSYLTEYFDTHIKPAADRLDAMINGEELVNGRTHWKKDGITHIIVWDEGFLNDGYELVDGEWIPRSPF